MTFYEETGIYTLIHQRMEKLIDQLSYN